LIIGAHPDDEDTELLTIAVRRDGAEAAYLSLNRGEGGQNLIGPELGEGLGLIRTEELLAARRIDGARQFFTRAYDFGYSKSLEDTWQHWPRDSILKDVVRVVRRFRPQVIVSVFSGTPADGHGQHQAAGWAAHEAFRVAGDSTVFPELLVEEGLGPWSPVKLYRSARFRPQAATLRISGGDLDPVVGQSYHQIAMRSRSQHRSQDMGRLEPMGPSEVRVALAEDRSGRDSGSDGLFAGVRTDFAAVLAGIGEDQPNLQRLLAGYAARVTNAKNVPRPDSLEALGDSLSLAWSDLVALMDAMASVSEGAMGTLVPPVLHDQSRHLAEAIRVSRGAVFDVYVDRGHSAPGDSLTLTLLGWNTSARPVGLTMWPRQRVGDILSQPGTQDEPAVGVGQVDTVTVQLVPDRSGVNPYFLQAPRDGAVYRWLAPPGVADRGLFSVYGLPFGPAPVRGAFTMLLDEGSLTFHREASYRYLDQAFGEVRRPVVVLPRLDVVLEPRNTVLQAGGDPRHFTVTVTNNSASVATGEVVPELPSGWPRVNPQAFSLEPGSRVAFAFAITVPDDVESGTFRIGAVARSADGTEYRLGVVTVDYPHIHARTFSRDAISTVQLVPLAIPDLTMIGYIRGAADRVPEALRDVGVPLTIIDDAMLARGDLGRFDVIVVGSRAYEINETLVRYNARLLDYASAGGLLLVQYQQYQFFDGGYAPFPMSVGGRPLVADGQTSSGARPGRNTHDRVADQTAAVLLLDPDSPVVTQPNALTDADWDGWVQERGLYFARSWDKAYQAVLEMHDPGEGPLEGSVLVADVGDGRYIYTGISFFRQLPAGVPGAYRLFMNMLAMNTRKGVS
jgi:LmbE family N-acetylglucosaminyl deacetylase